jgi:hypothetical protein
MFVVVGRDDGCENEYSASTIKKYVVLSRRFFCGGVSINNEYVGGCVDALIKVRVTG